MKNRRAGIDEGLRCPKTEKVYIIELLMLILCCMLSCVLLVGCATDDITGEVQHNSQSSEAASEDEDVVVRTSYGDLHYPGRWQEYVIIRQEQKGNTIVVVFETQSDDETYELFKIFIGDDCGVVVGSLTDNDGVQRNVYLQVEELPADSKLTESEQTRLYAMQEDLNYLLDNLK